MEKTKKTKEEILAKYFNPQGPKDTFRILPYKTQKYHVEAFFHDVYLTSIVDGEKVTRKSKIYCPAHNDPQIQKMDSNGTPMLDNNGKPIMIPAPCALCNKSDEILKKQDQNVRFIKKINLTPEQKPIFEKNMEILKDSNLWQAKKYSIIKGIDKGRIIDGVKFWRFRFKDMTQNNVKPGTLEKIEPILESFGNNFSSPDDGADLEINTLKVKSNTGNGNFYPEIMSVIAKKAKLHEDPIVVKQWLEDTTTWRDIFVPKVAPNTNKYEYLEMVANGQNPYWDNMDKSNMHWVFPGRLDLEQKANTRTANLDGGNEGNYEQATDLDEEYTVKISNIQESNVGTFVDDAEDITANTQPTNTPVSNPANTQAKGTATAPKTPKAKPIVAEEVVTDSEIDDLPF